MSRDGPGRQLPTAWRETTRPADHATRHASFSLEMSSARHLQLQAIYHVPRVFLNSKPTLTRRVRSTTHIRIRAHNTACADAACHHHSAQQSHLETLVPFASLSAISGTFNSLSKVLFTFPSRYLFSIGLRPIFSFRGKLPPN